MDVQPIDQIKECAGLGCVGSRGLHGDALALVLPVFRAAFIRAAAMLPACWRWTRRGWGLLPTLGT